MSLPNYLASIKSAGIYRFVWDKSQMPAETAQTLRLVVGYSEKGPFNTPVYIDKISDFKTIFGNINKRLEKKGIYFHRLALQALEYGPILALNIKPFTEEKTSMISCNIFSSNDKNSQLIKKNVIDIYDRNRFWTLDEEHVGELSDKYINVVMTGDSSSTCTLFVQDYEPDTGYDLTIEEYYNNLNEDLPEEYYVIKDMQVKKFFAQIYIFKGDFFEADKNHKYGSGNSIYESYEKFGISYNPLEIASNDAAMGFINKYQGILLPNFKDLNNNYISLDIIFNKDFNTHKMLMKFNDDYLDNEVIELLEEMTMYYYTENGGHTSTEKGAISYLMSGYTYETITDETGLDLQNKILEILTTAQGEGMRTALTNCKDVDYHYIVDTFDTYLAPGIKSIFTQIAQEKQNAFAILNFPKMKLLKEDASFTNSITQQFDITKLLGSTKISLPTEIEGASYGAFYTQLVITDGTIKTTIPSAALVSNNFMEKWNSRQPYYIVAGPNYGRIDISGLVGPDYNFGRSDLDVLEPYGVNALVYVPRKGTYINSNQTAKQNPVSGLSKVHIRELVIYLQDEIEAMLTNYHWELNTQTLRDIVKSKADTILETVKNNGGVYAYKNTCDDTNNTADVIDNEMLVLSTEIEPARGAGKMIQEITIHRTGGLTSS